MASVWRRQPGSGRIDHTSLIRNAALDASANIAAGFWETAGQLKVWTGAAWTPVPASVRTSTGWAPVSIKRWDGSSWRQINGAGP